MVAVRAVRVGARNERVLSRRGAAKPGRGDGEAFVLVLGWTRTTCKAQRKTKSPFVFLPLRKGNGRWRVVPQCAMVEGGFEAAWMVMDVEAFKVELPALRLARFARCVT